ncbi:MAG: substrate-binding domain-containing protein [Halieaceae bacterium]|jgi:phosphate transport system substrate-binding protein|nr:substrate-binding domain-containing protein [Halieaceae bacterium]
MIEQPQIFLRRCLLLLLAIWSGSVAASLDGKLVIVGSDTLAELMTRWAAGFSAQHPKVSVELQAGGSAAAPPALIRGTANVGSMSRRMSEQEKARFVAERGFLPLEIPLALDTIAIIVHRENPVPFITLPMIQRIFGDGACGVHDRIEFWGQAGIQTSPWPSLRVEAFGRTAASGTYEFFRSRALCGGDPLPSVGELPGTAAVIDAVASIPGSIGYAGVGFVDLDRVRVPPLKVAPDDLIAYENMSIAANYPLQRTLYLYLPLAADRELPALECEFLRYIRSDEGSRSLQNAGFAPVSDDDRGAPRVCQP